MKNKTEKSIFIATDYIKLDSLLKFAGFADSGGGAKVLVQNGDVSVNGEICLMRGKKIHSGDTVETSGVRINVLKESEK
ncbi:MAG: RNA-binding S4 domain-containing protein [Clostridiales bacterium]|nr:RNA-binding S4 domain-containing protein [Clostridiales bacterium]